MKIVLHPGLDSPVGTKVVDWPKLETLVMAAVAQHEAALHAGTARDETPGQYAFCTYGDEPTLPTAAAELTSCGEALRTGNVDDYHHRDHRGRVTSFLKREKAPPANQLKVAVYTLTAYLSDKDVMANPEWKAFAESTDGTHIVIGFFGRRSEAPDVPSAYRWVENVAGGNKRYDLDAEARRMLEEWQETNGNKEHRDSKAAWKFRYNALLQLVQKRIFGEAAQVAKREDDWLVVSD